MAVPHVEQGSMSFWRSLHMLPTEVVGLSVGYGLDHRLSSRYMLIG
jgi:hypothetical protein